MRKKNKLLICFAATAVTLIFAAGALTLPLNRARAADPANLFTDGGFEAFYAEYGPKELTATPLNGLFADAGLSADIVSEGGDAALKLGFRATANAYFFKQMAFEPGTYTVSFDVKYPDTINCGLIRFRTQAAAAPAGQPASTNSGWTEVGTGKVGLDALPNSTRAGWKTFSGTLLVDHQASHYADRFSFVMASNSASRDTSYLLLDNFSITLLEPASMPAVPSLTGKEYVEIVQGGNFEDMEEDYVFPVSEALGWTSFMGMGTIAKIDGSKALKIANSPAGNTAWVSYVGFAGPMADKGVIWEVGDACVLTFDFKSDFANPLALSNYYFCFHTGTNVPQFRVNMNYRDFVPFTAGDNPDAFEYSVEVLQNDWIRIKLPFRVNSNFLLSDMLSFVIGAMPDEGAIYIDNVSLRYYYEPYTITPFPKPAAPEDNSCKKTSSGAFVILALLGLGFVVKPKKY